MFKDPVFVSLYIIVAIIFWTIACGLIAWQSGWHKFAKKHPMANLPEAISFNYSSMQFNNAGSYNYSICILVNKEGIGVSPLLLFKAFHRPWFIKWSELSDLKEGKEFFWFPVVDVYVDENKIRFYGKAMKKIVEEYSKWNK
jgi:hypothetical protein